MKELVADKLTVKILPNRIEMGEVAASDIVAAIKEAIAKKKRSI